MSILFKKLFILLIGLVSLASTGFSQRITNAGMDFWMAFPEVLDQTSAVYWLNITSNDSASGTVSIPGAGFTQNFNNNPGDVAKVIIPSNLATIIGSDTTVDRAIHITSNKDVVVFAVTYHAFRHEASLVIPTVGTGTRYRSMSYQSEIKSNTLYESEFNVVSVGDTVIFRVTPTGDIAGGKAAGVSYIDTLLPNQVYQAQADSSHDDLTGTLIESLNGKKFAVYSGNVWSTVVCRPNSDPLMEAMFPTNTWGMDYFVVPTPAVNKDYIKLMADEDTTLVFKDGILVDTLDAGEFYDDTITTVHHYTTNKASALAQFLVTGQNTCTQYTNTDPSMIILNATEQMYLDSITFFAVDTNAIDSHFVHTLTRTTDTGFMFLDSVQMIGWIPFTQDPTYSYRTDRISPGDHRLETTGCGFIAYSMGIGSAVSYGYAAGASLVDLDNAIRFSNAINGSDTICIGDTIQFNSVSFANPKGFAWDFGDGNTDTVANPKHGYTTVGTYVVSLSTVYSCATVSTSDTVEVPPPPRADLGPDTTLCQGDTLVVSVNTHVFDALWNDGSTSKELQIFTSGNYWVEVSNYCGSDTDSVSVNIITSANIDAGRDTTVCQRNELVLGGNPTGPNNVPYSWSPSADLNHDTLANPILTAGNPGIQTFVVAVQMSSSCIVRDSVQVNILSNPAIDVGPDVVVCSDTVNSITLGGNPTGPASSTYVWGPADKLNNPNSANPTTKDGLPRVYTLLAEDTSGCKNIDSVNVSLFSFSTSSGELKCGGDTTTIQVTNIRGNAPYVILWEPNTGLSEDSVLAPLAFPDTSTLYQVKVTDSSGCVDSSVVFVDVLKKAEASFTLKVQSSCNEATITTVNNSSESVYTEWFLDGSSISNEINTAFELDYGSQNTVQLYVISSDSCSDSTSQVLDVAELNQLIPEEIANVFSPNGDGINDKIDFSMGNRLAECSTVYIYNRWGDLIFESEKGFPIWDGTTFSGQDCKEGVYFYQLDLNGTEYNGYVTIIR